MTSEDFRVEQKWTDLVSRLRKAVEVDGDYVEKWGV